MTKRWLVGLVAAIAVVCMAGVGFSAFTAQATVYGNASAASVGLQIVENESFGCFYYGHLESAPGSISFAGLSDGNTAVTLNVANLTPDQVCTATLTIENTGSQPLNVSIALNTPGSNGICLTTEADCFGVTTVSGITVGGFYFTNPSATAFVQNFTYLNPGQTYTDTYAVSIEWGSDNSTPSAGTFTLVYSATVGFNTT
ncbi:MAG: hypothetical protein ACLQD8_00225 [Thermoplasmata archaeon]